MKKKKFRHIHRFAYAVKDIGNTPWINEHLYDLLTSAGKWVVKTQGYIVPTPQIKSVGVSYVKYSGVPSPSQILKMLRNRSKPSNNLRGKILKKNLDRGITRIEQIPDNMIKRTPRWKK